LGSDWRYLSVTPISLGIFASANTTTKSSYESIAVSSVGSGGASSISFTNIPSTYTHLQVRAIGQGVTAGGRQILFQFNSDTGSNYNSHEVYGDGATVVAGAKGTGTNGWLAYWSASGVGAAVFDILDYKDTNKYKTTRSLSGHDLNGSGFILFRSGLWMSTSAITSISIFADSGNLAQYSHFALYGIKAAS
jgi:hypothetical protein